MLFRQKLVGRNVRSSIARPGENTPCIDRSSDPRRDPKQSEQITLRYN